MKPSISIHALPAWLAALALCAVLSACGGDAGDNNAAQPPAKPAEPGAQPAVTPQLRCAP
ncbi:hypothetical protein AB4Z48_25790 [Cupriavidus sp. 2TAF22]|uniref:hypothetical protein n=1 Tax=unclassified Cupriavidus TaxID=2640874 RepID=UPI003F937025